MRKSGPLCDEPDLIAFFCRHLIALCVTYEFKRNQQVVERSVRFAAYCGTLIRIENAYCFLTAGHCLSELNRALKNDQVDIKSMALADTFGWKQMCTHPIPFSVQSNELFYIDDPKKGLDFGAIILSPYYLRLLAANGIVALEEKNWICQSGIKFDGYAILGLPKEFSSTIVSDHGDAFVTPTMFTVTRLTSAPSDARSTQYPRFIGQISPRSPIKSVVGMSGGPIFGFRLHPNPTYWVVAIQSSWSPSKRIVYGCPTEVLGSLMTTWARSAESTSN